MAIPQLQPSKLGTKEHWDEIYANEVRNYKEFKDQGEIWFGDDSEQDIVDWIDEYSQSTQTELQSVLDVGTGNGHLLFVLYENGFKEMSMTGIDYSCDAIALAESIAQESSIRSIRFQVLDFVRESLDGRFDLILDKGTFDAISLSEELVGGRRLIDMYPEKIIEHLQPKGVFLLTSCNWTQDELVAHFEPSGLHKVSQIDRPVFEFGGSKGSQITTVAFAMQADNCPPDE